MSVDFDLLAAHLRPRTEEWRTSDGARVIELAPDIACVQLSLVNLYLIGHPHSQRRDWVLVDAGLFNSAQTIREAGEQRFGCPPQAIILTHGHFDHVGALEDLAREWNVPVYAHNLERPYLTGESSYPPFDPAVGGGAMSYLSFLYPRQPVNIGNHFRELPLHGSVPHLPGWKWIPTPGHTPGHVSLWRSTDRFLIAGDAIVTTQQESALAVLSQSQKVWRPPAYATTDWEAARASVERIADLEPETLATGHGLPMTGEGMRRELQALVDNWHSYRPAYGRYVVRPVVSNDHGVVSIPPPVLSPQLLALGGAALGLTLGMLLLANQNRRFT